MKTRSSLLERMRLTVMSVQEPRKKLREYFFTANKVQDYILTSKRIQKLILRFFTKQINPRYFGSCRSWCVKGTEVLNCSLKKLYCGLLPAQNADIRRRKLARLITQYRDKGSSRAAIAWREKNQENDMTEDLKKNVNCRLGNSHKHISCRLMLSFYFLRLK